MIIPQFRHCDCKIFAWLHFGIFFKLPCIVQIYAWFFMLCRNHHSDSHTNHVIIHSNGCLSLAEPIHWMTATDHGIAYQILIEWNINVMCLHCGHLTTAQDSQHKVSTDYYYWINIDLHSNHAQWIQQWWLPYSLQKKCSHPKISSSYCKMLVFLKVLLSVGPILLYIFIRMLHVGIDTEYRLELVISISQNCIR